MQLFVNNWSATLTAALSASSSSLSVSPEAAARLAALGGGGHYLLTLAATDASGAEVSWEIVRATAVSGGEIAVDRGIEDTVPADWPVGSAVSARLTAGSIPAGAGLQIGDALYTLRAPGADYLAADGAPVLQANYPELYGLAGLGAQQFAGLWSDPVGILGGSPSSSTHDRNSLIRLSDGTLLATDSGALWRSTDDGATWSWLDETDGLPAIGGGDTFTLARTGATAAAAWTDVFPNQLYISTDSGASWAQSTDDEIAALDSITSCASDSDGWIMLIGWADAAVRMLRSLDIGETWETIVAPPADISRLFFVPDQWVWLAAGDAALYVASDIEADPVSWTQAHAIGSVAAIATSEDGGSVLAIADGGAVAYSSDGGLTFASKSAKYNISDVSSSQPWGAALIAGKWTVFAQAYGSSKQMAWISADDGETWLDLPASPLDTPAAYLQYHDETADEAVLLGAGGKGEVRRASLYPFDPATHFAVPHVAAPPPLTAYIKAR